MPPAPVDLLTTTPNPTTVPVGTVLCVGAFGCAEFDRYIRLEDDTFHRMAVRPVTKFGARYPRLVGAVSICAQGLRAWIGSGLAPVRPLALRSAVDLDNDYRLPNAGAKIPPDALVPRPVRANGELLHVTWPNGEQSIYACVRAGDRAPATGHRAEAPTWHYLAGAERDLLAETVIHQNRRFGRAVQYTVGKPPAEEPEEPEEEPAAEAAPEGPSLPLSILGAVRRELFGEDDVRLLPSTEDREIRLQRGDLLLRLIVNGIGAHGILELCTPVGQVALGKGSWSSAGLAQRLAAQLAPPELQYDHTTTKALAAKGVRVRWVPGLTSIKRCWLLDYEDHVIAVYRITNGADPIVVDGATGKKYTAENWDEACLHGALSLFGIAGALKPFEEE